MKDGLIHLARAGLLGFVALFTVGALMTAAPDSGRRAEIREEVGREFGADDSGPPTSEEVRLEADRRFARRGVSGAVGLGVAGALIAAAVATILRLVFPVGPASKIVLGAVVGPFPPLVVFLGEHLRQGKEADLGGIVVLGALVGALAGLLEANRVLERRGGAPAAGAGPRAG